MARHVGPGITDVAHRVGPLPAPHPSLTLGGVRLATVGAARLYVCGITPYDVTHLGHAATFVWADLVAGLLRGTGVEVRVARNVTDVDDVLLAAAQARGRHYDELALGQEAVLGQSLRALSVAPVQAEPHARHHLDAVQQLAQVLLDAGAAYEVDGTVWFRGGAVAVASGLEHDEALRRFADHGEEPDHPAKEDPFDVPVWRASAPGEPAWPSPWGWGRPGWHAECAAMALEVHGSSVEVLAGGADLVFPHHAYVRAMASSATGVAPFARASLHVGEVRLDGRKMAKSTGNLVLVDDLLTRCSPAALRLAILDRAHDEPWDFVEADLARAEERLAALYRAAAQPAADRGHPVDAGDPGDPVTLVRDELAVPAALDAALEAGGEPARALIAALRLA
ncbi:cysteine--tRNA ligase [Nocardioides sp. TRM66260-LWL]|uniref:cysteine--tRNA ligase n=1 Tax=Nocardioides sp. TRM66260-LWL TaxID=2874478 RepID=UPI001CC49904|nr:cysteine--tRNA ligase [Nocardioides sp. TRM66260-LWL]MBZ5736165.1 cysteine--tRNA ligase [Nocardioides sp. TRM66260-LWL]